jgi:plasmid stability protein
VSDIAINAINEYIDGMASMTIRNIDETVKRRLRLRAAENGRSLEAEARAILGASVAKTTVAAKDTEANLFDAIRRRFEPFGGVELNLPVRRGRQGPKFR